MRRSAQREPFSPNCSRTEPRRNTFVPPKRSPVLCDEARSRSLRPEPRPRYAHSPTPGSIGPGAGTQASPLATRQPQYRRMLAPEMLGRAHPQATGHRGKGPVSAGTN
jgi:hypothetical protein